MLSPSPNMSDKGYPDSCAVAAIVSVTGKPYDEVATRLEKAADKDTTAGGFSPAHMGAVLKDYGFGIEQEHADYLDYLLGMGEWPKKLTDVAKMLGVGKAILDILLIPGNPDTTHAVAYENGTLADCLVSPEPVSVDEWLVRYHKSTEAAGKQVWGEPEIVGFTHITQNPIPKGGIQDGVSDNPTAQEGTE